MTSLQLIRAIVGTFMTLLWVMGIVVAKGFWMTVLALFPLAGWCIAVHHVMQLNGWL